MGTLRDKTLALVRERARCRGLRSLARETGIANHTLYYLTQHDDVKIDVDVCQRLYEHLSGQKLITVDHVQ